MDDEVQEGGQIELVESKGKAPDMADRVRSH
jgi:hypothetical protein